MDINSETILQYFARAQAGGLDPAHPVIGDYLARQEFALTAFVGRGPLGTETEPGLLMGIQDRAKEALTLYETARDLEQKKSVLAKPLSDVVGAINSLQELRDAASLDRGQSPRGDLTSYTIEQALQKNPRIIEREFGFQMGLEWREIIPSFRERKMKFMAALGALDQGIRDITPLANAGHTSDSLIGKVHNHINLFGRDKWQDHLGFLAIEISTDPQELNRKDQLRRIDRQLDTQGLDQLRKASDYLAGQEASIVAQERARLSKYFENRGLTREELEIMPGDAAQRTRSFVEAQNIHIRTHDTIDSTVEQHLAATHHGKGGLTLDPNGLVKDGLYPSAFGIRLTFDRDHSQSFGDILRLSGEDITFLGDTQRTPEQRAVAWRADSVEGWGHTYDSPVLAGEEGVTRLQKILDISGVVGIEPNAQPLLHAGAVTAPIIEADLLKDLPWIKDLKSAGQEARLTNYLTTLGVDGSKGIAYSGISEGGIDHRYVWHEDTIFRGTKYPQWGLNSGSKEGIAFATPNIDVADLYAANPALNQRETHFRSHLSTTDGSPLGFIHAFRADQSTARPGGSGFLEDYFRMDESDFNRRKYKDLPYKDLVGHFISSPIGSTSGLEVPLLPTDTHLGSFLKDQKSQKVVLWSQVPPHVQAVIQHTANQSLSAVYISSREPEVQKHMMERTQSLTAQNPGGAQGPIDATITRTDQGKTPTPDTKVASTPAVRGKVISGAVGAVTAIVAGAVEARQKNSTVITIADASINSAIPGWSASKRGDTCRAFGEIVGAGASMVAMGATAAVAVPAAVAVSAASGPAAPIVAPLTGAGAAAIVGAATIGTEATVTPAAELTCKGISKGISYLKRTFDL